METLNRNHPIVQSKLLYPHHPAIETTSQKSSRTSSQLIYKATTNFRSFPFFYLTILVHLYSSTTLTSLPLFPFNLYFILCLSILPKTLPHHLGPTGCDQLTGIVSISVRGRMVGPPFVQACRTHLRTIYAHRPCSI
jgi:hypothetical protein